ncbi:hypothetical protein WDU94_003212 [Cyamophila willieti]
MMHEETTVVVRHVPQFLGRDQMDSLFASFGATGARILAPKTKKAATAFVNFRSLPEAQCAVTRLHQMDVRGFRLSAELSNKTMLDDRIPEGQSDFLRTKEAHHLSLLKRLGLDKCPPNGLKYKYPQPTLYVLLNIVSSLVEHKKFYTQVLHLMNKMNLSCPFNQQYKRLDIVNRLFLYGRGFSETQLESSLDELVEMMDNEDKHPNKMPKPDQNQVQQTELSKDKEEEHDISIQMVEQSESDTEDEDMESELEDEEGEKGEIERTSNMAAMLTLKRALERKKGKGLKRPKFIKPMLSGQKGVKRKGSMESGVFETPTPASSQRRRIQVNVPSVLSYPTTEPSYPTSEENVYKMTLPLSYPSTISTSDSQRMGQSKKDVIESISKSSLTVKNQTESSSQFSKDDLHNTMNHSLLKIIVPIESSNKCTSLGEGSVLDNTAEPSITTESPDKTPSSELLVGVDKSGMKQKHAKMMRTK